jgi:carbonic anhydrase
MDLEILNAGKDFFIEQLKNERRDFFEQALTANHKVGELVLNCIDSR